MIGFFTYAKHRQSIDFWLNSNKGTKSLTAIGSFGRSRRPIEPYAAGFIAVGAQRASRGFRACRTTTWCSRARLGTLQAMYRRRATFFDHQAWACIYADFQKLHVNDVPRTYLEYRLAGADMA
jgi:hypothetical protein